MACNANDFSVRRSRLFLACCLSALVALPVYVGPTQAKPNTGKAPALTNETFQNPPRSVRPMYRWWLPLGATTDAELRLELQQMAQAGAGGVEVDPMPVPGPLGLSGPFIAKYGWGTPEWTRTLQTIYTSAPKLGLNVDLMVSPLYPIALPAAKGINDPSLSQQLIFGAEQLESGATRKGPLPAPRTPPPSAVATICSAAQQGDKTLWVSNISGMAQGDTVRLGKDQDGQGQRIASLNASQTAACTTMLQSVSAGSSEIVVSEGQANLLPDAEITLGTDENSEKAIIKSVKNEKKGARLALATPLRLGFPAGTIVVRSPAKIEFDAPLSQNVSAGDRVSDQARTTRIAVMAMQCVADDCGKAEGKRTLSASTYTDLTSLVSPDGELTWTAPTGGAPWWIIAFYQTADGQTVAGVSPSTPDYVINYISPTGMNAIQSFYDQAILTPALRKAMKRSGGALFEDSYEPSNSLKWTPDFLVQFEKRRGYALTPFLPILVGGGMGAYKGYFDIAGFSDRIREDYRQTWSDLYRDNHLLPFHQMARRLGLKSRVQIEGGPMEVADLAGLVDIPEGENRNFLNNPELFKVVAAGAQFRDGLGIVSAECCPISGASWATTMGGRPFTVAQATGSPYGGPGNNANLNWVYKAYIGGVNQLVWHGFPYKETPQGTGERSVWPGNSFDGNTQFSEAFGPRMPQWQDLSYVNDHLGRLQLVLRQGTPQYDIAVFWHDFGVNGIAPNATPYTGYPGVSTMFTTTSPLAAAGFTYQYISPTYIDGLNERSAGIVGWGRLGFKAVVINQQSAMPVSGLTALLRAATTQHLPLFFVGATPDRSVGMSSEASKADVGEAMKQMETLAAQPNPNVFFVKDEIELSAELKRLAIQPSAAHVSDPGSSAILSLRRHTPDADYYVLFNQGISRVTETVSFEGVGTPVQLDLWSGRTLPIGVYKSSDRRVELPVEIGPNDVKVFAVTNTAIEKINSTRHAISTSGGEVLALPNGLTLRTEKPGDFSVVLTDGRNVSTHVAPFSSQAQFGAWTVEIESWTPDETGAAGLEHTRRTVLKPVSVTQKVDSSLATWAELGFADVAGIGTYRTSFDLPAQVNMGMYLDLGTVVDTFQLSVNGKVATVSYQDASKIDLGPYLRPGRNEISLRIATPLRNAVVKATDGDVKMRVSNGLLGPVILRPYVDVLLMASTGHSAPKSH